MGKTLLTMTMLLALLAAGAPALRAGETDPTVFAPRPLRGFGPVDAVWTPAADGRSSLLQVNAASPALADRWHAKYVSDLTNTIGTVETVTLTGPGPFAAHRLPGGALATAVRDGHRLWVAMAEDEAGLLAALADGHAPAPTADNTRVNATLPMFLDSWDQYAFRFYYRFGEYPPGTNGNERHLYDVKSEFEYAKDHGRLGLVVHATPHSADAAGGMTDEPQSSWALRMAANRRLPIVLNTSASADAQFGSTNNIFREDNVMRAPHYSGSYRSVAEPGAFGLGGISWAGHRARRSDLQALQRIMTNNNADPVIEWQEPHGEMLHSSVVFLTEYGPVVDASYREFMQRRHGGDLVALSIRHHGRPDAYETWDDVRLPELAEFLGWNERAVDLSGAWRFGYLPLTEESRQPAFAGTDFGWTFQVAEDAPEEFYQPDFDDSEWPLLEKLPGDDRQMFLKKSPAVLRRRFHWDGEPGTRMWLRLWDLNNGERFKERTEVHLNGLKVGEDAATGTIHHNAYDVTEALVAGENLLALRLPKGSIGYRVYLTPDEPKSYPYLGREMNARWVDFIDWQIEIRRQAVEMGVSAIREIDPDRSYVSMSPDSFFNHLREFGRRFGGHFHNTGYMSGMLAQMLPMLMNGADLPFSLEPSEPARDLVGFKASTGRWMVSGVNAVHYFIHIGNILWNDEIRDYFEKILPALRGLGQRHKPKSEAAVLLDSDINMLQGFPWGQDLNASFPSGYWAWRFSGMFWRDLPFDALTPVDFENGLADKYKVIFDANNTIVTPERVAAIRAWVERGGIFVAATQSGRHLPEEPDAWPMAELTGFVGTTISFYHNFHSATPMENMRLVADPALFPRAMKQFPNGIMGDGVRLKAVVDDVETLWEWPADGSTAVGRRRLGRGTVYTFGIRTETHTDRTYAVLSDLVDHLGLRQLPLLTEYPLYPSHNISNNGLFDVWSVWNESHEKSIPFTFRFRDDRPRELTDILTGEASPAEDEIAPFEFRVAFSPREWLMDASREWFRTQYNWWQGAEEPPVAIAQPPSGSDRFTLDLTGTWQVRELPEEADLDAAIAADDGWREQELGLWIKDEEFTAERMLIRKTFTVPEHWQDGEMYFWSLAAYSVGVSTGDLRFFLDGEPLADPDRGHGPMNVPVALKAGQTATLAVVILTDHARLFGMAGSPFLSFEPTPDQVIDLSGVWRARDRMAILEGEVYEVELPGPVKAPFHEREFTLPEDFPDTGRVVVRFESRYDHTGLIINGRFLRRHHHVLGDITRLDITPWLNRGGVNNLMLVRPTDQVEPYTIKGVALRLYDQPLYPLAD